MQRWMTEQSWVAAAAASLYQSYKYQVGAMTNGISANTETFVRQQAYNCREPLKQTNKQPNKVH